MSEPAFETVEETPEEMPEEMPEETEEEESEETEEESFIRQRAAIAERLKDEETFRLCIAEIYMQLSNMDKAVRTFAQQGGLRSMMKMLMGRGPE